MTSTPRTKGPRKLLGHKKKEATDRRKTLAPAGNQFLSHPVCSQVAIPTT